MPFIADVNVSEKNFLLNINGVPCGIYLGENGGEGYGVQQGTDDQGGRRATVYFHCYYQDLNDLIAGLVGTVDYVGGAIVRNDPFSFPVSANDNQNGGMFLNRLFCTSISNVTGTGPANDVDGTYTGLSNWLVYAYAIVQAEFTSPAYLIEDLLGDGIVPSDPAFNDLSYQTYCISNIESSPEVFAPPTGSFIFATGTFANKPLLDTGASQVRTRSQVSITRVRMPLIPSITATQLYGTVNQDPFMVGGQLFPMNSMLFNGMRPTPRSDPYNGGIIWDVEYQWLANSPANTTGVILDWNYFLDPSGAWNQVTTTAAAGSLPVFPTADHTTLFSNSIN
jgi:hypothetical protein